MRRTLRKTLVVGVLVLLASVGLPSPLGLVSPAEAVHVHCGMVITQSGADITLDSDVGPCTTDGIIIQADNVTLNLNGFDVFGDANTETVNVGIRIQGTQNQVVDCAKPFDSEPPCSPGRQDSEVRDFNTGIFIEGGSSNEVCRTTVRRNIGIGGLVGEGILIHDSNSNTIVNNTVDFNGPFAGVTVLGESDGNKLGVPISPDVDGASLRTTCDGGNTIKDNQAQAFPNDIGIRIEPEFEAPEDVEFPSGNTLVNNLITRNALDGIAIFGVFFPATSTFQFSGSTSNAIKSNTVTENGFTSTLRRGDGIRLNGRRGLPGANADQTTVEDNVVRNNAAHGVVLNSSFNNIKNNTVSGNGVLTPQGHGILINNDANVVNNFNNVFANAGDGISIGNSATGNQIKQNTANNQLTGSGIRTALGAVQNNIMNNTALGNNTVPGQSYDLEDENPNADPVPPCESNTWQSNQEVTKNQPCID